MPFFGAEIIQQSKKRPASRWSEQVHQATAESTHGNSIEKTDAGRITGNPRIHGLRPKREGGVTNCQRMGNMAKRKKQLNARSSWMYEKNASERRQRVPGLPVTTFTGNKGCREQNVRENWGRGIGMKYNTIEMEIRWDERERWVCMIR